MPAVEGRMPLRFMVVTILAGAVLLVAVLPSALSRWAPNALLFLVLVIGVEAISLPSRSLSVGFALTFPTFILFGAEIAAWNSALGFILGRVIQRRQPLGGVFCGGARSALSILAAAGVYKLFGGGLNPLEDANWFALSWISPIYFLVNYAFIQGAAAFEGGEPFRPSLSRLGLDVAAHLVLTSFGLLLAIVNFLQGLFGLFLVIVSLGAVIHLMRLLGQLEMANNELRILHETSHRLNSTLRLDRVFAMMTEAIVPLVRPQVFGLFLFHRPGNHLEMKAVKRFFADALDEAALAAWRERITRLAVGLSRESDGLVTSNSHEAGGTRDGLRSLLLVPLVSEDRLVGVIAAGHRDAHRFNSEHLRLLSIMSGQVAAAIENALLYEKTEKMAITDPMTDLYNYRYFYRYLQDEVRRARNQGGRLSLVYLDLESFKQYNDCFGHQAGDDILRQFAEIVRKTVRQSDVASRYAGDEFVVILPGANQEEAWEVIERIRVAVANHVFRVGARGIVVHPGFSVGVACFPDDALTEDELIYKADKAMYTDKTAGEGAL